MFDPDKTEKVTPLIDLLDERKGPTELLPEVRQTDDESLATASVFRRFALWMLGQKKSR